MSNQKTNDTSDNYAWHTQEIELLNNTNGMSSKKRSKISNSEAQARAKEDALMNATSKCRIVLLEA